MDLIQKIAKSRNVLLEMLSERGYQTAPYENFTIDDIPNGQWKQLDI